MYTVLFLRKFAAANDNELQLMKLYLFNPDSDLALANNEENYMAPASARRMAQDLALLPVWYAQPGSAVLAPSAYNADFLKQMKEYFPLQVQLVTEPELPDYAEAQIMPWGWNPALRKRLLKGGILERKLPTLQTLAEYRPLSSRIQTVCLTEVIRCSHPEYTCGSHYLIETMACCKQVVKEMHTCLLKAPWSGSGKGLNWCRRGFTKSLADWCERVIKEQGCLLVEPIYNKVEDFAIEFYSDGQGKILFVGYSLFSTNEHGAYTGNILISDKRMEEWVEQYIPLPELIRIRERLQNCLATIYGNTYTGYLGVDMMVCRSNGEHRYVIHPCVEINMRMNMGIVSRFFYDRFVASGHTGRFNIEYFPTNEALRSQHEQDMREYPLIIEDGKLISGYLPLVPITPKSRYRAFVEVMPQV